MAMDSETTQNKWVKSKPVNSPEINGQTIFQKAVKAI